MVRRRTSRLATAIAIGVVVALLVPPGVTPAAAAAPTLGTVPSAKKAGTYIVQLADAPVASYAGGRAGLQATKPGPGQKLNRDSAPALGYAQFLGARHNEALASAGAPAAAKFYDYHYSFNGFAAELTPAQVRRLEANPAVVKVTADELKHPLTDNTPEFLGLTGNGGLWDQLGGKGAAGEDVILGVIDTGIWPEHPSFSAAGDRPATTYDTPPASWKGKCPPGQKWARTDCNNKLIGARYFLKGFGRFNVIREEYKSPRDADGHGTHTASTAGGNSGVDPSILGNDLGVGRISGLAPRARIAAYKVCWNGEGCAESDLVAAIDSAVSDGVDVINYSIGGGSNSVLTPDAVSFLFAADAGVFVAASNGNNGPGEATGGSPAHSPWVTAVGASTHDRTFQGTAVLGNHVVHAGASVTQGTDGSLPLVDGIDVGSELCIEGDLIPAVVVGKIVLCKRGVTARIEKSKAVAAAGGKGMILFNGVSPQEIVTDNHFVPTVHLTHEHGMAVREYIVAAGSGARARLTRGRAVGDPTAPVMAAFSSRGPNEGAPDVIKPDVTAPGVNILAGNTPTPLLGPPGQLFQSISGTSMSSPHVAGAATLLTQLHPTWSPAMVRSALMTSGHQNAMKEDGVTPADPFDMGAGHIAPTAAADPGLVYDAGFGDYIQFLCGSGDLDPSAGICQAFGSIDPSDLNLPSIGVGSLAGVQTVTRTVTNVGPGGTYDVSVDAPPGISVVVDPPVLSLTHGQAASYTVTLTTQASAVFEQWAFGSITWHHGHRGVRSPVAVRPVKLAAPREVAETGPSGSAQWEIQFGYTGPFSASVHGLIPAVTESRTVVDDPANDISVALLTGVGVEFHTVSVPAGSRHLRAALFDEETDGEDDLDLYLFDPDGNFVDGSGSGSSAETVDAEDPIPGNWTVVVHGWQTDGPSAQYTLSTWELGDAAAGNLSVTAPPTAALGDVATITASWTGLTAGIRYLGSVSYATGSTEIGETLVAIHA